VRVRLVSIVSLSVPARRLDSDFQDRGETVLTKSFMLSSLVRTWPRFGFALGLWGSME
jgi:hypothetical protein